MILQNWFATVWSLKTSPCPFLKRNATGTFMKINVVLTYDMLLKRIKYLYLKIIKKDDYLIIC